MSSSALGSAARPPLAQRLKRAAVLSLAGIAAAAVAVYVGYSTPSCSSGAAEDLLREGFASSGWAKARGLAAVKLQAAAETGYSFGDAQRTCTGTLLLTNTARMDVRYSLTGTRWDGVVVEMDQAR